MKEISRLEESSVSDDVWLAAIILWQCLVYAALLWALMGR